VNGEGQSDMCVLLGIEKKMKKSFREWTPRGAEGMAQANVNAARASWLS